MATPQTYTSTNDITIPTAIPQDQGQTVSITNIGATQYNYGTAIRTQAQMFEEVQDLIALMCRATVSGLSTATAPVTPREVITQLIFMLQGMLRTNEAYS